MDFTEINADMIGEEKGKLNAYIQKHRTAMLTVMFTDIEGYTELTERKGDSYVAKLRQYHDELLKTIIEENGSGMVVKFIGDAVMAVFSEPSTGVKRAVDIQLALEKFNREHAEFEDISVRIGLHVGQIAVEDDVQLDIFGRHVNRAARVESLATGGQILATYPVWDSAKGWLDASDDIKCISHGGYLLKGIPEAIEIFEIYLPELTKPAAPAKGKVKSRSPLMKWVNLALLILVVGYLGFSFLKGESLLINTAVTQNLYLNGELLNLSTANDKGNRTVENEIAPGVYQLSYKSSSQLAYMATVEVGKGQTIIKPDFTELSLPSLKLRNDASKVNNSTQGEFSFITTTGVEYQGQWALKIESIVLDGSSVQHTVSWQLITSLPNAITTQGLERFSHDLVDDMRPFETME
ncbi:MAG: class 3 adenylate cyclase, partial [Reinekea sp.]